MLSVSQLARLLQVTDARARSLVASGAIHAERVAGRWVVADADAAAYRRKVGRPLSRQNAWRLAAVSEGCQVAGAHSTEVARLHEHLKSLDGLGDPLPKLRTLLANRAEKVELSVSPADLAELRRDTRLRLSGVSHPMSGLLANAEVEAYVDREDFEALVREWLLVTPAGLQRNVVLHIADSLPADLPVLLVAADLAERSGVREQGAGRTIFNRLRAPDVAS